MKVEVREKDNDNEKKYPYLGKHKDLEFVILFHHQNAGTILHSGKSDWEIGHYGVSWAECSCKPFHGEVVLSND